MLKRLSVRSGNSAYVSMCVCVVCVYGHNAAVEANFTFGCFNTCRLYLSRREKRGYKQGLQSTFSAPFHTHSFSTYI